MIIISIGFPWRMLLLALLCAASAAMALPAQEGDPVAVFNHAFSSDDGAAKRAAISALSALGRDEDDTVYRLLVQAVADRASHDAAVMALRARSGLSPNLYVYGPGYPGYPPSDDPVDWSAWLAARARAQQRQRTLDDQSRRIAALERAMSSPAGAAARPAAELPPVHAAPAGVGRLSRIIFVNGAAVVGHIVARHRDANGAVLSLEFIHPYGGGREVIPIDRIARIEDDAP